MTTTATVRSSSSARWYYTDGKPCYELPKKDGKGMKKPTLADARKLNLLPSVTTVLQLLDKPALNDWRVNQGILAVETTPKLPEECEPPCPHCGHAKLKSLDAFLERVIVKDRVHEQEGETAREEGTEIHNAMEAYFLGAEVDPKWLPWIEPAAKEICKTGELVCCERILVGQGYAGKTDLVQKAPECWWITDWKSAKTLPDPEKGGAWNEHKLQAAAYAKAWRKTTPDITDPETGAVIPIRTRNVYISRTEQGKFAICDHDVSWGPWYEGFVGLLNLWCLFKGYRPDLERHL